MSTDQKGMTDVEARRQEAVAEMAVMDGPAWSDNYRPGTFGCHELLDRVHLISSMFQQHVVEHSACLQNPDWYRLAECAVEALQELYHEIGTTHLGDDGDGSSAEVS